MGNEATTQQIQQMLDQAYEDSKNPDEYKRAEMKRLREKKAKKAAQKYGL